MEAEAALPVGNGGRGPHLKPHNSSPIRQPRTLDPLERDKPSRGHRWFIFVLSATDFVSFAEESLSEFVLCALC